MQRLDRVVGAVLLAVFAGMTYVAFDYQYEARLMPLVIGVPAMVLAAVQCLRPSRPAEDVVQDATRAARTRAELLALGWLAVFSGLVIVGGVLGGGSLAVVVTQRIWLRESWRTALIGGAVSAALLLVIFERHFGIALFQGLLAEGLR